MDAPIPTVFLEPATVKCRAHLRVANAKLRPDEAFVRERTGRGQRTHVPAHLYRVARIREPVDLVAHREVHDVATAHARRTTREGGRVVIRKGVCAV
jgi:hypothetical protein